MNYNTGIRRRLALLAATLAVIVAGATHVPAQGVPAIVTSPANGATNVDLSQAIQWTTVPGVQAYYLYVGTSVGTNNLLNTGEILATSYLAPSLPGNQTLYARMWTKVGGIWWYSDSTFTGAPVARLTFPANGAVNVNMSQAMQWSAVANVQAYYLYVGTTPGANDLVNTGETQATSYVATGLPSGQTLYARMWAKVGNVWRHTDTTFTAAAPVPLKATLTFPADGAVNANMTQPFQWTTVPNVAAYYLYVGTTVGANNLVNTGETQATSYQAAGLPSGQTLYARMWTRIGTVWRYNDSTFTAAPSSPVTATLTYPANGAADVSPSQPLEWTTIPDVQAYYLYVGTSVGAKDVVNTGEILQTSHAAVNLPMDQTLYVRIWTKVAEIWRYSDSTFSMTLRARLTYPADGAVAIDQTQPATWTTVAGTDWYYLYIGTTPGTKDLLDSSGLHTTSVPLTFLPAGQKLFARLWTAIGGVWRYRDSTFTAAPINPVFVSPVDGAVGFSPSQPFQWTPPANAQLHRLRVGTSPGANDLFDSGEIGGTSVTVDGLPVTGTLYARASSKVNGVWRHADIAFTLENAIGGSTILSPADGELGFDTAHAFEWSEVPLARGYRLSIGTTPGGSDVHNSGEIRVTRRFVPNLPVGPLFGRLETKINGQWLASDFTFAVGANTVSATTQIETALWATNVVRQMALGDNRPFTWTELADEVFERRAITALCNDYAETLLRILQEVNIQLPAQRLDIALNPNNFDAHTLVELFDTGTNSWMLLDPTFSLTVRRTADDGYATAEDMQAATTSQQWGDISYQYLDDVVGDAWVRNYYLDYPILFVNLYHGGPSWVLGQGGPVLPYMETATMPVSGSFDVFAVGCTGTAELLIDGVVTVVSCNGVDGLSYVFGANAIAPTEQTSPSVVLYRPKRFVF